MILTIDAYERLCADRHNPPEGADTPGVARTKSRDREADGSEGVEEKTSERGDGAPDRSTPALGVLTGDPTGGDHQSPAIVDANGGVASMDDVGGPVDGNWLDRDIPRRFSSAARSILAHLIKVPELVIVPEGTGDEEVLLSGERIGFTTKKLVRALAIPFTRALLPESLRLILEKHQFKARNHFALRTATTSHQPSWHHFFRF